MSTQQRPAGVLPRRRPVVWHEIALVAVGYSLYSLGRDAVPDQATAALRHARDVAALQATLHLNWELRVNRFVAAHGWLAQICDYYYAVLHFLITPVVLAWLFLRHPTGYRGARTALFATTLIALIGFVVYPTAPPRLLTHRYVDTVAAFHTWGSLADPDMASAANQYAAMPSLHVAWALWCAVCVCRYASRRWVRLLAVAYPAATIAVVIGTANHFVLDAVAAAGVLGLGFAVQWALSRRGLQP